MPRHRVYSDAAAKQRAYREHLKARRRKAMGPTGADLARAVRDLHIRLEYEASVNSTGPASELVGKDALETLRNAMARLFEREQI